MTQEQIINVIYRLQCCSSTIAAELSTLLLTGDKSCKSRFSNLLLLNDYITQFKKYNTVAGSINCITEEQFTTMYNNASELCKLCDCGTPFQSYNSPYTAPLANITLSPSPALVDDKLIRSIPFTFANTIDATITRTSSKNMITYALQRSYDNSSWTTLSSNDATNPVTTILGLTDLAQPANQNNYYVRAFVSDEQVPAGQAISAVASFGIYQPVLYGYTTQSNPTLVDLTTLVSVPQGAGSGQLDYANSSADKTINGLFFDFNANPNFRFCIAYDDSYGTLTSFSDGFFNYISNFTSNTKTLTFGDGTVKTYKVYVYNLTISSGTYTINTY